MSISNHRTRLIVGIDYGTTYSGLCFALSNASDFKDIFNWTKYPGAASHSAEHSVKAPSRIAFKDDNDELDDHAWGYQVEPGMNMYALTKLALDQSALPSEFDAPDLQIAAGGDMVRLPAGKSAKDVATAYLKEMRLMFEDYQEEILGSQKLDKLPIDFWLTVPASWSDKAKLLTKAAAIDAGFGVRSVDRVMLIPEPEAAAHYALKSSIDRVENYVEVGNGILVCDCGGGTVDITTYEVEEMQPTLKLREVEVGAAGKCGGAFVDLNLVKMLESRFGHAFTSLGIENIGPGSFLMDQFEKFKKDFHSKSQKRRAQRIRLHMPELQYTPEMAKFYERKTSSVLLTFDDFKALFDPVVQMVIKLIESQVSRIKQKGKKSIDTLILVGGFGSSPYLKETVSEWCVAKNIRFTTPVSDVWSAVVRGAVLRGLEGSIVREKKCRRHYGHQLAEVYIPSHHSGYDRKLRYVWTDVWDGKEYLTGCMHWEISKGETIGKNAEINSSFFLNMQHRIERSGTHDLYSCGLDDGPKTIEHNRVEKVGTIKYDLSGLNEAEIPCRVKDGKMYYKIGLTLNIRLDDEVGHLVFRILHQGEEVGKATLGLEDS